MSDDQALPRPNIINEVAKVENYMLERATKISSMNELYNFYFSYSSVFVPTLEFAANHLTENSICQLANFGILIDHLCQNQIALLVNQNIDLTAREIAKKTGESKSKVLLSLNDLTLAQKIQLSTTFLSIGSITRDAILQEASSKLNVINKAILWSNIFSTLSSFPFLLDFFSDLEMLTDAEKDLRDIKYMITNKKRVFDNYFAAKWAGLNNLSEKNLAQIPKLFIGTKLNYLRAMEGLNFCKYIVTKEKQYGEKSLEFNKKIQALLTNQRSSSMEWSYRNFDSNGPTTNLYNILVKMVPGEFNVNPISTTQWLITSADQCLLVDIPSNFNFYFSTTMTVTYNNDKNEPFHCLAMNDVGTIIEFGKNPAEFVIRYLNKLAKPEESIEYLDTTHRENKIKQYLSTENIIEAYLEATYEKAISSPVLDVVKNASKTSFEAMLAYGILVSIEKIAAANGIALESETWVQIRTLITGVLVAKLSNVVKKQKSIIADAAESEDETEDSPFTLLSPEEKVQKLYENIANSEKEIEHALEETKDAGLIDVMEISNKVKGIILSGLSPDEIKLEIEKYFDI